jgi:hypothetical protein
MTNVFDLPSAIFVLSFLALWLSTQIGASVEKVRPLAEEERPDLDVVKNTALTLAALLIGFTFSMAVSRYDQRKKCEADEANAIGTEYVRAGLLPSADSGKVRECLKKYLDQRVLYYDTHDESRLRQIHSETGKLQDQMWSAVQSLTVPSTPVVALAVIGMNEVLNSEGYTQAAWWNRIPIEAWSMMAAIAVGCSLLTGYGARRKGSILFVVLPLITSIAFFLIADIDSPRGGVVRVRPQNLTSLSLWLRAH